MTNFSRYLVTAALPYANGPVHIGHLAGCYLPADIYVRWLRARKIDVKFICGTDEHGVPITIKAMNEGVSPQKIVDQYHEDIRASFEGMGISFDIFSRTTNPVHQETARAFFLKLYEDGKFQEQETEQFFDEEKGIFLADRYIVGTCPVCGYEKAYGDQCERCGSSLSPDDLIHPRSALSQAVPVKKKTKHWYMPLQDYEPWLRSWLLEGHQEWKPNVYGQCKSWLDQGLHSRAMTRDSNWGVKVPLPGAEGKVLYVWFDAPIGYISATQELTPDWERYWKSEDTRLIHFIGKDNIVFHCIIFPAMLKAHGGYVLPDNVPANEFLNIEGEKVSTSRNWAVWVKDYLKDFEGQQDVLRYVLCSTAPETKDNDFTWKDFQDRNNGELVATLGNFVNRTMVLMHKLCSGKVPPFHEPLTDELDRKLVASFPAYRQKVEGHLEQFHFRDALSSVMELARDGNKYLQQKEPWILAKTPGTQAAHQQEIDNCIHVCLQLAANLAILINPFLPFTARKICHMMKVTDRMLEWENAGKSRLLSVGYSLRPPELLFRKVEDEEVAAQLARLHSGKPAAHPSPELKKTLPMEDTTPAMPAASPEPSKPLIQFEDFAKLDLRIGTITAASKLENADKLLQLTVDIGPEKRTVLSGIAIQYKPEDLVGRQVTLVANLAPRKMRGVESQGMVLMAHDSNGKLVFLSPTEPVREGSPVS